MALQALPLDVSATVTLNASGAGTVRLGPRSLLQVWNVTNCAVKVSSNTLEPVATVYLGNAQPGNQLDATQSGSLDSTNLDVTLRSGNVITVAWTGGDAGAVATASLYGNIHTGRP